MRIAVAVAVVVAVIPMPAGCGMEIDVIDCIDINGSCEDAPLINRPSLADTRGASGVAVDGLYIAYVDGSRVEFRGSLEPSPDQAMLGVRAYPLAEVELAPYEMPFLDYPHPYAIDAGAVVELVVRLRNDDRARLVDQALALEGSEGVVIAASRWDLYGVEALADLPLTVIAAEQAWDVTVPVAPRVDDIVAIPTYSELGALPSASEVTVCFAARSGELHVAGLTWTITGEGVELPSATPPTGGCVVIREPQEGQALRVTAGGVTRTFTAHLAP